MSDYVMVGPEDDEHPLCVECLRLIDFEDHAPGCPVAEENDD